ncbi:serine/threonine-protein kinase [Streptomyces litchfieldiae]|uniref:Serine/threonine-protein kinase n=1 Tax=Streptomyces litchfieldiae TaxID=3075543 RepID=A0ABU2ML99_9ACTN|nr:serine/threonine-protein kinase [Streptomyces sp. DSM 44938]MDT0342378.1 serine/threonine-protein kinase [Streptomyces sp. DSM 44938]
MSSHETPSQFSPLGPTDPREVAGYRLQARLGSGGMGSVYLSYTRGGQPIAVKVVRAEFAEDPEFRRRFELEVRAARRVQGLYTVPVLDSNTEGAAPWLATAYVPGLSLSDVVRTYGPLPPETVLLLVGGVAEALQSVHAAGIIHRDLKPGNVLLAADGPKVIDFGIARAADVTALTGTDARVGTPSYMAPEQITGSSATPATDVFALGIITCYAATGTHPFGEGAAHAVMYRIVQDEPDLSRVPEQLRHLIHACLAKNPAARPTPAQVIEACRVLSPGQTLQRQESWLPAPVAAEVTQRLHNSPPLPAPPTPPAAAPSLPPTPPSTPPSTPPPPAFSPVPAPTGPQQPLRPQQSRRRMAVLLAATAVVAAMLGGVLAVQVLGDGDSETPEASSDDDGSTSTPGGGDEEQSPPEESEEPEEEPSGDESPDEGSTGPGDTSGDGDPNSPYEVISEGVGLDVVAPLYTPNTDVSGSNRCGGGNLTLVDLDEVRVQTALLSGGDVFGEYEFQYVHCGNPSLEGEGIEFHSEVFAGTIDSRDATPDECFEAAHAPTLPNVIPTDDILANQTLHEDMGICVKTTEDHLAMMWIERVTVDPYNEDLPSYTTSVTVWRVND